MLSPSSIVDKMISSDPFSQWLDIKIISVDIGYCKLKTKVTNKMTNGFRLAHGGVLFSIADSCLAFSANSFGKIALTKKVEIQFFKKIYLNDIIIASCKSSLKKDNFTVLLHNQEQEKIGYFIGTVHFSNEDWI